VPTGWTAKMRASMTRLTPQFSTNRTVREYTEKHYLVAADRYRERAAKNGALGAELLAWRREVERGIPAASFGAGAVESDASGHKFTVEVQLGELSPDAVRVELYADGPVAERHVMERRGGAYVARVETTRPAADYTVRIVPYHASASVPLEAS